MSDIVPFYEYSLDNARHCNEVDEWRASHKANIDCKKAIENAIADNYKDYHLEARIYDGIDFVDNDDKIEAMFREPSKADLLHIAISKLKPKQRDLINAIYFEGISVNDYAAQEGVKQNAISMRLARAKNNLKKILEKP